MTIVNLGPELAARLTPEMVAGLSVDERAAIEAATGELGNKPDAVKIGWLKMRTKESWTKQRYTLTVARARDKITKLRAANNDKSATGA